MSKTLASNEAEEEKFYAFLETILKIKLKNRQLRGIIFCLKTHRIVFIFINKKIFNEKYSIISNLLIPF